MSQSSSTTSKPRRRARWWLITGAAVLLVALVAGAAALMNGQSDATHQLGVTYTAKREPFLVNVTESGSIESRDRVVVKSQVEGQRTIIFLIDEGTQVEEGDLLVELDGSGLEDQLTEQQIQLENAEAELVSARENLAVVKNQAEANTAQAKLDYEFAQQDLKKYREGEYAMELKKANSKITLARAERQQAEDRLTGSQKLYDKRYISETELESDKLAHQRAKMDLELALQEKDLLESYTYDRQITQLKSDVEQAKLALERAKRKARANIAEAEARFSARKAEVQRKRSKTDRLKEQLANCKITAPTAGMVVYAPQGRRWDDQVLEEGANIRERQELIYLPTADAMSAQISVHESVLNKVRVGHPARITVDALPNASFTGKVSSIAVMPEDGGWRNPDLKQYKTSIAINEVSEALRSGMTCEAEIVIARYEDALIVPLQAVLRVDGEPTVFAVGADGQPRMQAVKLGLDNNSHVRITAGLEPGTAVLMNPPLDQAERREMGIPEDAPVQVASVDGATDDAAAAPSTQPAENSEDQNKLSEEQMRMMRMMQRMNERGMLDRLELDEDTRAAVDSALAQLEEGETPELSDEAQQKLRAKMNAIRNRMEQRRDNSNGQRGQSQGRGDR